MADLKLAPERPASVVPALIVSLVVLVIAAVAIFYFNPHRVADFHVASVDTFTPQTTFGPLEGSASTPNGMHVLGEAGNSTEENLYVIAHVRLTDKLRLPLFLSGAVARLTLSDGTQLESNLLSASDLQRLEEIFPTIGQQAPTPITDGDEVSPGQTLAGAIVLPFPGQSAAAWHDRKNATLTLQLRNQEPQTAMFP